MKTLSKRWVDEMTMREKMMKSLMERLPYVDWKTADAADYMAVIDAIIDELSNATPDMVKAASDEWDLYFQETVRDMIAAALKSAKNA